MGAAGGARSGAARVRTLLRVALRRRCRRRWCGRGADERWEGGAGWPESEGREVVLLYSVVIFPLPPFSLSLSLARALARTPVRDEDETRGEEATRPQATKLVRNGC
jgi:hypothetical protein